ncbi:DUF5132 domain-containing protein [Microvirga sp. TS319]|uniref:DUF5132 domain-containing protein n=1 Tax=Microvirga sp. TS319 TaxID=3241165 RepID=UPI00351A2A11
MALYDDMLKGMNGSGAGLVTGVGALLLAPVLLPAMGRVIRPVARLVLESGIVLYRETGETIADLVSEARAELEAQEPAKDAPERSLP